jgi:hypothetical protein
MLTQEVKSGGTAPLRRGKTDTERMRTFDFPSVQDPQTAARADEPSLVQLVSAATLGLFTELGPSRFTRLLDALAECEQFHDLTMID